MDAALWKYELVNPPIFHPLSISSHSVIISLIESDKSPVFIFLLEVEYEHQFQPMIFIENNS